MLHVAAASGDVRTAKTLISVYGIPVDIKDWEDDTPISYASRNNNVYVVSLLVEHGADVHAVCIWSEQRTPLHTAANHGCMSVARWLLRHGVNPNKTTTCKRTVLHMAVMNDDVNMVRLLA